MFAIPVPMCSISHKKKNKSQGEPKKDQYNVTSCNFLLLWSPSPGLKARVSPFEKYGTYVRAGSDIIIRSATR